MKWFKHYSNASDDHALQELDDRFGTNVGYGIYFKLVALCTAKYEGDGVFKFTFNRRTIRGKLGINYVKIESFLDLAQTLTLLSYEKTEFLYEIEFPKLAKFVHKDGMSSKTRRASGGPVAGPTRIEETRLDKSRLENSAARCDESFNPFNQYLNKFLSERKLNSCKRLIPSIIDTFETQESFDTWCDNIRAAPKYRTLASQAEKMNYFTVALKKEVGDL